MDATGVAIGRVEVAQTFVGIAKQAKYEDKIVRNLDNARKACKAIRHFMDRVQLSEDEAAESKGQLERVENESAALERLLNRHIPAGIVFQVGPLHSC